MTEDKRSEGMSLPVRLLISAVSVGAMYGLGRLVRTKLSATPQPKGARKYLGKPKLRQIIREPEAPQVVPAAPEFDDRVVVPGDAEDVYDQARQLEYFDQFLFGVDEFKLVNPGSAQLQVAAGGREFAIELEIITETRGEFFGLRIESGGELYGTCLVRFEEQLTKPISTAVSVSVKYKHKFDELTQKSIEQVVSKEIHTYLHNLKSMLESREPQSESVT